MQRLIQLITLIFMLNSAACAADSLTWKLTHTFGDGRFRHSQTVTEIQVLPGGAEIISSGQDGVIRIWNAETGEQTRSIRPGAGAIWDLAFLSNGSQLLAACHDKQVVHIDLESAKILNRFKQASSPYRVTLNQKTNRLVAVGNEGLCSEWDLTTGKYVRDFPGQKKDLYTALLIESGARLLTGSSEGTIHIWNTQDAFEEHQIRNENECIYTLLPFPKTDEVLVCSSPKSLWAINSKTWEQKWDAQLPKKVMTASFSPDGTMIAAPCADNYMYIVNSANGAIIDSFELTSFRTWAIAWAPDGKRLYYSEENLVCTYELKSMKRISPPQDHSIDFARFTDLSVKKDGKRIYALMKDKAVHSINPQSGEIKRIPATEKLPAAIDLSPDDRFLAVIGDSGRLTIIRTADDSIIHESVHGSLDYNAVHFTDDGKQLVAVGDSGRIAVWESGKWELQKMLPGKWRNHGAQIDDMAVAGLTKDGEEARDDFLSFSMNPTGSILAGIVENKRIELWNIETEELLEELHPDPDLNIITKPEDDLIIEDGVGDIVEIIIDDEEILEEEPTGSIFRCAVARQDGRSIIGLSNTKIYYWQAPKANSAGLSPQQLNTLIQRLGAESFKDRRAATKQLIDAGPKLLECLKSYQTQDPEVRYRIAQITAKLSNQATPQAAPLRMPIQTVEGSKILQPTNGWICYQEKGGRSWLSVIKITPTGLQEDQQILLPEAATDIAMDDNQTIYVAHSNGTFSILTPGNYAR